MKCMVESNNTFKKFKYARCDSNVKIQQANSPGGNMQEGKKYLVPVEQFQRKRNSERFPVSG